MFITCTIRWDGRPRLVTALDAAALRRRIADVLNAQQACLHDTVGAALPALNRGPCITTFVAGRDGAVVSTMVSLLHVQGTPAWLRDGGAPSPLRGKPLRSLNREPTDSATRRGVGWPRSAPHMGYLLRVSFDLARAQLEPARFGRYAGLS